jgi:hypothetical protein
MNSLVEGLRRLGVVVLGACAVALIVLAVATFVLPRLGPLLTCFFLSPGGLILIGILYFWMRKRGGG